MFKFSLSAAQGLGAADDLEDLLRDLRLPHPVHLQRQAVDHVAGVLGGAAHRRHPGAVLRRRGLEQRPVHGKVDVLLEEELERLLGIRLVDPLGALVRLGELGVGGLLGLGDPLAEDLGLLQRQQRLAPHVLRQRRDVAVVDQLDPVDLLVDVGGDEPVADLAGVGEGGLVGEAGEGVGDALAAEAQRRVAATADDVVGDVGPAALDLALQVRAGADDLGVERAREPAVAGDEDDPDPLDVLALLQELDAVAVLPGGLGDLLGDAPDRLGVRPHLGDPLLGPAQARSGHHLHRPRDLADVLDGVDPVLDVLLRSHGRLDGRRLFLVGGLVGGLFGLVLGDSPPVRPALPRSSSDLMRSDSPSSSSLPSASKSGPKSSIISAIALPSSSSCSSESRPSELIELNRSASSLRRRSRRSAEERRDALDLDPVEVSAGAGVDRRDLLGDRERLTLALVERLDEALTAGEGPLGLGIELGAELGERLELAVLREVEAQLAGDLLHRLRLRVAADPGDRDADVDRRPDARVEEVRLEEDLTVGDRDHVRRDVGRDVGGLRLDDRQRRQRAAAEVVGELHAALQQAGVQVEDVARVGLAARRAAQQQRHLAVRVGVLGEVVVDAERVAALVREVLGHRGAGVRRHELDRSGLVGGGGDDDGAVHRAGLLQRLHHLHDGRHALADRDVDADDVLILVVDDRVDRDRGLAGLAVADDQLALAAADRDHRVDRLQAGLHRLLDALALDHAGGLELGRAGLGRVDVALAVEGAAERIDQAAEELVADGDLEQAAGALHRVALDDVLPLAEEHGADAVLLEVEREPGDAVGKLEHLQGHAVVEPVDAGDSVGHGEHGADLGEIGAAGLEALDALPQDRGDLVWLDFHLLYRSLCFEVRC